MPLGEFDKSLSVCFDRPIHPPSRPTRDPTDTDLCTALSYTSISGNKYGFVIVDDYTRYTYTFFLVDKIDVFATFKSFVKGIHNEFETTIKKVRSDNGREFKNIRIDELCDNFRIRHQFSAKL